MQLRDHLVPALLCVIAAGVPVISDASAGDYELLVEGDLVSLKATQSPLARVLRDLGGKAGFEVDADISDDVTVTLAFMQSPIDEAIAAICKPVGYLLVRDPTGTRVRKVVLTPKSVRANRTVERQADPAGWRPKEPSSPDPLAVQSPEGTDGGVDTGKRQSPARPTEQEAKERDD